MGGSRIVQNTDFIAAWKIQMFFRNKTQKDLERMAFTVNFSWHSNDTFELIFCKEITSLFNIPLFLSNHKLQSLRGGERKCFLPPEGETNTSIWIYKHNSFSFYRTFCIKKYIVGFFDFGIISLPKHSKRTLHWGEEIRELPNCTWNHDSACSSLQI